MIAFIIIVIYLVSTNQLNFNISTILSAIINLCLLQSWTSDPYTFNSVMWFLSSLMFCYFMSPFLMTIFKKSTRFITCTFISCTIIRILLELASINGFVINIDFHVSPIIRCLEFFMGMMMFSLYQKIKNSINNNTTLMMTIIEIIVTALYIFLAIKMEGKWIRGYFVLLACLLVFVYALNGGLLSKLLSTKIFSFFTTIQMEFYIFHQVIIRSLESVLSPFISSVLLQSIILFFITIAVSFLYKRLLKKN